MTRINREMQLVKCFRNYIPTSPLYSWDVKEGEVTAPIVGKFTSLRLESRLFTANVGDCRTILCHVGKPYPLSKDHVASCLEERERVIGAGGNVNWQVDTWRVGPAALQVTRSIGDDDLKPYVTAEPEITEILLSAGEEYIVMASDGLWDVVSNTDVVNIIRDTVKEAGMCSKRLATEAAERGNKDNITVIVVFQQLKGFTRF